MVRLNINDDVVITANLMSIVRPFTHTTRLMHQSRHHVSHSLRHCLKFLFWFFLNHLKFMHEYRLWRHMWLFRVFFPNMYGLELDFKWIIIQLSHNITSKSHNTNRSIGGFISIGKYKTKTRANYPHSKYVSTWVQSCVSQALISIEVFVYVFIRYYPHRDGHGNEIYPNVYLEKMKKRTLGECERIMVKTATGKFVFVPTADRHVCVVYLYLTHNRIR